MAANGRVRTTRFGLSGLRATMEGRGHGLSAQRRAVVVAWRSYTLAALLRLSALLQVSLCLPAGKSGWPCDAPGRQNPGSPEMGTWHLERAWHQTQGNAQRTYQRLTIKHDAHVGISLNHMVRRMRLIEARFGDIGDDLNLFRKIEG